MRYNVNYSDLEPYEIVRLNAKFVRESMGGVIHIFTDSEYKNASGPVYLLHLDHAHLYIPAEELYKIIGLTDEDRMWMKLTDQTLLNLRINFNG